MSERTTTRAEAADIKRVMMQAVDKLEEVYGFDRSQVGSVMVGIGGGLVAAHIGVQQAAAVLDSAKDAALASKPHS